MSDELVALLAGRRIGVVRRDRRGQLAFLYDESWRAARGAYPLSLSMPLAGAEHAHKAIDAFLWGLLPDNPMVLDRWARRFQVSPRNAFALIGEVGEDCAGAVQFARPERVDALIGDGPLAIEWLDEAGVAERLRALRADHAAWRGPRDTGQFSLAGAQPKTALFHLHGRWGVPAGRTATTHILKPPTRQFDGHAENEHLCLTLAGALGLTVARSQVRRFEDEVAIVVERYDRRATEAGIVRVHQEDMGQALAVPPTSKYENEGGPNGRAIVELIRRVSGQPEDDENRFVDALIFNWLVAGTDAHAKNYSLLIGAGGRARLAPLYDIASALPYDVDPQKLKLAMKIGGQYRIRDIGLRQWQALAMDLDADPDSIVSRATVMAEMLPDHVADMGRRAAAEGLDHPLVERLAQALTARAERCKRSLSRSGPSN